MQTDASVTCRECGARQAREAAKANGARCASKICSRRLCLWCGCTEITACLVRQPHLRSAAPDYCAWVAPGVCSNPSCVERAYRAVTPEEARAAQAYHEANRRAARRRAMPTVEDLRDGRVTDERGLVHVILNHLLREEQGYILSSLDVDCFDLIEGNYGGEAEPAVREIFRDWNELVGREYFTCGGNLLAAA